MANAIMTRAEWLAYLGALSAPAEDCFTCAYRDMTYGRNPQCRDCKPYKNDYSNYKQENEMSIVDHRFRHETSNDTLVLQVSEQQRDGFPNYQTTHTKWRDAKVEDLLEVAKLLGTSDKSG